MKFGRELRELGPEECTTRADPVHILTFFGRAEWLNATQHSALDSPGSPGSRRSAVAQNIFLNKPRFLPKSSNNVNFLTFRTFRIN